MYAVPIWRIALHVLYNAHKLSAFYRRTALRVSSAFKTISDYAAFVISRMVPIGIIADEMTNI